MWVFVCCFSYFFESTLSFLSFFKFFLFYCNAHVPLSVDMIKLVFDINTKQHIKCLFKLTLDEQIQCPSVQKQEAKHSSVVAKVILSSVRTLSFVEDWLGIYTHMANVGVVFQRQTNLFIAAYMENRINIKQYKLYNYIDLEAR